MMAPTPSSATVSNHISAQRSDVDVLGGRGGGDSVTGGSGNDSIAGNKNDDVISGSSAQMLARITDDEAGQAVVVLGSGDTITFHRVSANWA